jgi:glycine betaine catabolism A
MPSPAEASPRTAASVAPAGAPTRPGRTPDGSAYWDPTGFAVELEFLFGRHWLCVGREEEWAEPGDFVTRSIGGEGLLFVRDAAGQLRGFHNLCRHRGTRVVPEASGRGRRTFVCPYHAWTYDWTGRLVAARHMEPREGFDRSEYGLYPVRVESWEGFVFANLDERAPALPEGLGPFFERFRRYAFRDLVRGARREYEVEANWKVVVENFSECYHCAPVHPNLNRITPYTTGANDLTFHPAEGRSLAAGGYMNFAGDYQSMTRSGYTSRPPLPGATDEDRTRVYYYVVFPNLFFSLHPDYLMIHRVWPVSPSHSRVENEFYFPGDVARRPDFDPSDAVDVWDEINRQDWNVCELAQAGAASRRWTGGPYSDRESMVRDFDEFVAEELARTARDRFAPLTRGVQEDPGR